MLKVKGRSLFQFFVIALQFVLFTTAHALPFSVVPYGQLPTTVPIGGQVSAVYTVTNNTRTQRNNNVVKWLPPHTTVTTSGCGSQFNLAPNARCLLNLNITGPINANIADPEHHLFICFPGGKTCAGTANPLNVTVTPRQQYAYIANNNENTVSICKANSGNTLSNCHTQTDPSFTRPADVILNSDATLAYVANSGSGKISICRVNANNGLLNNCQLSDLIYSAEGYPGLQIINHYLYASDYWASTVASCPVHADGTLGPCVQNSGNGTFVSPNGRVAFNSTGTRAYVPNYWSSNDVSICQVNPNGTLSGCIAHVDPAIFKPIGTSMNSRGDYLYIANGADDSHIVICPVNPNGSLGSCTAVSDPSFALGDYQLNFFVSANQYIYSNCSPILGTSFRTQ